MIDLLLCLLLTVSDGDTIKIDKQTVRLSYIDAPELKQSYGSQSKAKLTSLLNKKKIVVSARGVDKYRRTLGVIYANGKDINAEMVRSGYSWGYMSKKYLPLQTQAQKAKRGLWKEPNPTPPWEFRRKKNALPTP